MYSNYILKNFYCIEGVNGVGKSILRTRMCKRVYLGQSNHKFNFLKEPSYDFRKAIEDIKIATRGEISKTSLGYLYFADRLHTIHNDDDGVLKSINKGDKVIIDRYLFSTWVYQDMPFSTLPENFPLPEKIFYLYASKDTLVERLSHRKFFEYKISQLMEFHNKYLEIFEQFKDKIEIIKIRNDDDVDIDIIAKEVLDQIDK